MKLIQRRRLGLPIPGSCDVAWEFSKGEMSLEKSLFDWFDPAVERNVPMQMPLHEPRKIPSPKPRHDAALENIRTNATREVKPQKLLDDGISAMPLLGTGHEEHTPDPNAHHEPGWVEHDTKTIEEVQQDVAEEEWMEEETATMRRVLDLEFPEYVRRILEGDFSNYEIETKDNVVAEIPFAELRDIEPEVVMPDEPKTVTEGIKAARARTKRTVEDVLNSGMVTGPETTPRSVIEELHGMAGDGGEDATKIFYNNQDELVRHGYDAEHEFFPKGIQTIVKNQFANPFYDIFPIKIKKKRPKG